MRVGVEPRGDPLEASDRLDQRVDRLRLEEHRGGRLGRVEPHHRLESPAARQGDRRAPGGGGLERRDAEVLDRRKDESPAARVEPRSEEHTSELQSLRHLVCRLLLEKKKKKFKNALTQASRLQSSGSKKKRKIRNRYTFSKSFVEFTLAK